MEACCPTGSLYSVVSRWKEHFCNLVNRPLHDPPDVFVAEAEAAIPDADTDTHPPLSWRLTGLRGRSKQEKLLQYACGIYPEYIRYGGHTALSALNELFVQVWEQEDVPDVWRQWIIIPLYKSKGSRSECSNYRGITLLSAAGKVLSTQHHVNLGELN